MATWQQKGEVPDSDDEDAWDSQSSGDGGAVEEQAAVRTKHEEQMSQTQQSQFHERLSGLSRDSPDPLALTFSSQISIETILDDTLASNSSPFPRLEQPAIDDYEHDSDRLAPLNLSQESDLPDLLDINVHSSKKQALAEAASKSYVVLSSPLSSPGLSMSPPSPFARAENHARASPSPNDFLDIEEDIMNQHSLDEELYHSIFADEVPSIRRRNLRQRAPIQLHPFALEAEKYRRTLQGRGLKPVRMEQVNDPHAEHESQDAEFVGDDDIPVFESNHDTMPTSSSLQLLSDADMDDPFAEPEELASKKRRHEVDHFPDISELVSNIDSFRGANVKRFKSQYGSKGHNKLQDQVRSSTKAINNIWDVPDSPPPTSSPDIGPQRLSTQRNRGGHTQTASMSVTSSPPVMFRRPIGIPTPSTSAVKGTIDLTAVNFDVGMESGSDDGSNASSSSDQSTQVRTVGRRIKGVLPASWLRLDRQAKPVKLSNSRVRVRESRSLSPEKFVARRGVAIPRMPGELGNPMASSPSPRSHFLLDEETDDEEPENLPRKFADTMSDTTGFMIEEDRIDAMLPTQKRQAKLLPGSHRRRVKKSATSLFRQTANRSMHQPKIYDSVPMQRDDNTEVRYREREVASMRKTQIRHKSRKARIAPPKLSILDNIESLLHTVSVPPAFVRIAARTVRKRPNLGRQSPSRKFIRLDNREDTADAQDRLVAWRAGTIAPRHNLVPQRTSNPQLRPPLRDVSVNLATKVASWVGRQAGTPADPHVRPSAPGSEIGEIQGTQTTMSVDAGPQQLNFRPELVGRPPKQSMASAAVTRPAQLEITADDYTHAYPDVAFRSNKKALDIVYRKGRKQSAVPVDARMSKFLYDDDPLARFDEVIPSVEADQQPQETTLETSEHIEQIRRKKKSPKRLDTGAAKYRQPRELIKHFLGQVSEVVEPSAHNGKLYGLAKYGTVYTYDFDIVPLPSGVFFHESTFIGSGQLQRCIYEAPSQVFGLPYISFQIGGQNISWSTWNETVSAELGLCFDWLTERLELCILSDDASKFDEMINCLMFMLQYLQRQSSLISATETADLVRRFHGALQGHITFLPVMPSRIKSGSQLMLSRFAGYSARLSCLTFAVLHLARQSATTAGFAFQLEDVLKSVAATSSKTLMSLGLKEIRELCEDLQYLTRREAGIKSESYSAEAWITLLHILNTAKMPRFSFWDVFNLEILSAHKDQMDDAHILEQIWYSMFSLLPLVKINSLGILESKTGIDENWSLVVKLSKSVFTLYSTGQRQTAGFNDYCRAMFGRCHYLMEHWGWRHHGAIVGPLFDFFASQKLTYLRNEPLVGSPQFLQNLHLQPSLALEAKDVCFHMLLKIIALSFKQMTTANDDKNMRNLVTRLLPNHDRHYPKEEDILEVDLASLRNHHDILCTLFWAAPANLRPPLNLIKDLVNPERSHKAAYFINLRAWVNLAQFSLAIPQDSDTYTWPVFTSLAGKRAAWEPFAKWQADSFGQLLDLYHSAETIVQGQLNQMPDLSRNKLPQAMIDGTVRANKLEIMGSLTRNLSSLKDLIGTTQSMDVACLVMQNMHCQDIILATFNRLSIIERSGNYIVEASLELIQAYMYRLNTLVPATSSGSEGVEDEDSQDYGADIFDTGSPRLEYIGELDGRLKIALRDLLKRCFKILVPINKDFVTKVVQTWALLAGTLIMAGVRTRLEFVSEQGDLRLDGDTVPVAHAERFCAEMERVIRASGGGEELAGNITNADR